ncbi:MAG: hypothetical protein Q8R10_19560 [Pseudomonas sp.]|uniref:hypothetical protein n=1 Tax=Pseudomonas sp. TaxID=306 RepID=UPI00273567FD|nr:hypothetical protein [Pseudomonas sp.]MDP3848622.1 hypothetical protein [Pseudomonas sp.]
MNPLTAARLALIARLETISSASGYITSAGTNVRTGWLNELLKEQGVGFPLIVVQQAKPSQAAISDGHSVLVPLGFSVVGAVQAGIDYEAALEDLTLDLIRCLTPSPGVPVAWRSPEMRDLRIKPPEFYPPGDGVSAATVLFPVELSVVIAGA